MGISVVALPFENYRFEHPGEERIKVRHAKAAQSSLACAATAPPFNEKLPREDRYALHSAHHNRRGSASP